MRIILLGFSKSGTSSFHKLFQDLGMISLHYEVTINNQKIHIGSVMLENKNNGRNLFHGIEADCITEMNFTLSSIQSYFPQIVDYERLYEENKESIFILNRRNPITLLKSFKKWTSHDKTILNNNPELFNQSIENDDDKILDMIERHYSNIVSFFSDKKFIDFDIEHDDISKLNLYIVSANNSLNLRCAIAGHHKLSC